MDVREDCEIKALKDEFRARPKLIALKLDAQKRLKKIRREISQAEKRKTSRKCPRDKEGNIIDISEILAERIEAEEKILSEIQKRTLDVERALAKVTPYLTPLELLLMTKLYIEDLSWTDTIETLQNDKRYNQFFYERTTYMRAHKSAFKKILELEKRENSNGG